MIKTAESDVFFAVEMMAIVAGAGEQLALNVSTGKKEILDVQEVEFLRLCQEPRTVDGHRLQMEQVWQVEQDGRELQQQIADLHARGWLQSGTEFWKQLGDKKATAGLKPPRITSLAIPMRGAGPLLERCLESAAAHFQKEPINRRLVLASEQDDEEEARRIVKRHLPELTPDQVSWIGPKERREFVELLVKEASIDPKILAYALCPEEEGIKTGSLRNALLLDCLDEAFLMSDDDTIWDLRKAHHSSDEVLGLAGFSAKVWGYELLHQKADQWGQAERNSLFSCHEKFLGFHPGDLARGYARGTLKNPGSTLQQNLRHPQAQVVATACGYRGDSALEGYSAFFNFRDNDLPLWLAREEEYVKLPQAQGVSFSAEQAFLGHFASPTMNMALMGQAELPPFPPLHRCQDTLFQLFLQRSNQGHCSVVMPQTLRHERMESRLLANSLTKELAVAPFLAAWVTVLFKASHADIISQDYSQFGTWLKNWVHEQPEEAAERLKAIYFEQKMDLRNQITTTLSRTDICQSFRAELHQAMECVDEQLTAPASLWPRELLSVTDPEKAFLYQLGQLGYLLEIWPDILKAARGLKKQGRQVSRRLL
jgi:hypothetical protein